ncbi:MAG: hypothetical protein V4450_07245 [Bacteroidota bacterium]
MRYLKIQNNGLLDIRLVALMGGTTKSSDKYKIGQFGTGLKYTLAFLFRNNLDFKIFVGKEEVKLHIEREDINGSIFEIICINGNRTSITTKMGEDWSAWMIIRELWCNALDEGGAVREVTDAVEGTEGMTTFFIQEDIQVKNVLKDWNKYFIHDAEPIHKDETYALYPAGNRLCIYKKGVLIFEHENHKSVFSYDIGNADINELREFKGSISCELTCALVNANEKAITYFLENVTDHHYEGDMDYNWFRSFSNTWRNVIGTGKIIYQKVLDELKARGNNPDESTLIVVPENLYKALTHQFEGIGAVYLAGKSGGFFEDYNADCEAKIKQGLTILETCGYLMHADLTFKYGFFEDKRIHAMIHMKEKVIMVSNAMLQKHISDVVAMLIEENEHFMTGMADNTREFQQHFIDLYTRQLLAAHQIEI